jgi:hypothetical protein
VNWSIQEKSANRAASLTVQVIQIDIRMNVLEALVFLTSFYPLARAWHSSRATTLLHALSWGVAAWLAWLGTILLAASPGAVSARYLALCLTACASVAVLGARRPIVGAWNFVVLGLLVVLLLPLAENTLLSTPLLDPLRLMFAIGTIAIGVLNYFPTRFGLSAILVGIACLMELFLLRGWPEDEQRQAFMEHVSPWLLAGGCWIGLFTGRRRRNPQPLFDKEWLAFRDCFGLMWGQRVREQFNRAAANFGWPVFLRWRGLRKTAREAVISSSMQTAIEQTLSELLKRFRAGGTS